MSKQTGLWFLSRLAGALMVLLVGIDGTVAAADPLIDSILVRYQDAAAAPDAVAPAAQQLQRLSRVLGVSFRVAGRTRDGAFRLQLDTPLAVDQARAAINRVRLGSAVLYANAEVTGTGPTAPGLATDRLIVRYRDAAQSNAARQGLPLNASELARLSALGGQPLAWVRSAHDGGYVLQLPRRFPADQVAAVAAALARQPDIEYAEPDAIWTIQLVPTDPCYASAGNSTCASGYQWDLFDPTGGINMPAAWDKTTGSASINVAVIDTGALFSHPDLAGRFLTGYDMIADTLVANDGDARDGDPSDPGDWITAAENASGYFAGCGVSNSSWHGTHVAGTIGALPSNGIGIAGINWVSKIVPVRVLGKCGGYTSDINDAIVWAAGGTVAGVPANSNPARVINMSLGGSGSCPASTQSAINTALGLGTLVAVAAGNSNSDAANFSPANCNGVITVAATTKTGARASYSNFGTTVEIAAPGGDAVAGGFNILSTINNGAQSPNPTGWIYANYAGTSMATPHVTGVVSLMLSVNPLLTPAQVLAGLQGSARAFPSGSNCTTSTCGAGILDAGKAVAGVAPAATTTALASLPNPSTPGQSVTFTAQVAGAAPTGTVAFADNGSTLAGCGAVALSGGGNAPTAQCVAGSLAAGTHPITASYGGDSGNAGSMGSLSQVVSVGTSTTVTVTVTNDGPNEVTAAAITDPVQSGLLLGNWTCAVTTPGVPGNVTTACGAASGTGPLNTTVTLQVNGVITYTIAAVITAPSGTATNRATVTPPLGTVNGGTTCTTGGGATRSFDPATGSCTTIQTIK